MNATCIPKRDQDKLLYYKANIFQSLRFDCIFGIGADDGHRIGIPGFVRSGSSELPYPLQPEQIPYDARNRHRFQEHPTVT